MVDDGRIAVSEPRVTVAIVNFNHGRYVGEAIDSALSQTRPPDQIVVVDDGSTDDSRAVLARYPQVDVMLQDNAGPSAATNAAVARADGEVVVALDADDLMEPCRVKLIVDAYMADPSVQWVWHPLRHIARESSVELGVDRHIGFTPGRHDIRAAVARGRLPMTAPATSGLSWRTEFLRTLLPIPVGARGQDLYLKFASMALAPGTVLGEVLAAQGIHATNAYTGRDPRQRRRFGAQNAVEMLDGFARLGPALEPLSRRFAAEALFRSRLGVDLTPEQRSKLVRYARRAGPAFAPAAVVAAARVAKGVIRRSR